jgi:two-component system, cell cycle sensor histidine kinase and response regulator CckA
MGDDLEVVMEELRVHRVELQVQNEELRRSERERLEMWEERERALERLRDLYENAPVGYVTLDALGIVLEANAKTAELLAMPKERILREKLGSFVLAKDRTKLAEHLQRVFKGLERDACDLEIASSTGATRHLRIETLLVEGVHSERRECRSALMDITDRVQAEEHLLQARKMEAVARLGGAVAHDVCNLLMGIAACAENAIRALEPTHAIRPLLEQMQVSADRGTEMPRRLLAFSRPRASQPLIADVAAIVKESRSVLGALLGERVELRISVAAAPLKVVCEPGQIDQLLLNLAANARDAMPTGGCLTITVAQAAIEADEAARSRELAPGRYVTLTFADTGIGMDEDTRARAFEPYFTTKSGSNHGLGLAIVYTIVKQSRGHIELASSPERGTTVTIYLRQAR